MQHSLMVSFQVYEASDDGLVAGMRPTCCKFERTMKPPVSRSKSLVESNAFSWIGDLDLPLLTPDRKSYWSSWSSRPTEMLSLKSVHLIWPCRLCASPTPRSSQSPLVFEGRILPYSITIAFIDLFLHKDLSSVSFLGEDGHVASPHFRPFSRSAALSL